MNQDETTTLWRPQKSGYPGQSDGEEMADGQNDADGSYLKRGLMEILAQQRTLGLHSTRVLS